jgi:hypothetical protein
MFEMKIERMLLIGIGYFGQNITVTGFRFTPTGNGTTSKFFFRAF